jgi:hypothetical protein
MLAAIDLAPGYSKHATFCALTAIGDCKDDAASVVAMPATVTSFDDEIDDADGHAIEDQDESRKKRVRIKARHARP